MSCLLQNVDSAQIGNSHSKKLLGVIIENELSSEGNIKTICGKTRSKLNELSRVALLMKLNKRKLLMNACFKAKFNYCPLMWMLQSRKPNNKINRLPKKCTTYEDHKASSEELLEVDNIVSVRYKNLQCLANKSNCIRYSMESFQI